MNNRFIVAGVVAVLLLSSELGNAGAAGPYDGEWKGTATAVDNRCQRAGLSFTVEGQIVLGQARFGDDTSNINGSVDGSGAVGATIGFHFLRGQFDGDGFEGHFKMLDCQWEALLRRTTPAERNRSASDGPRGQ